MRAASSDARSRAKLLYDAAQTLRSAGRFREAMRLATRAERSAALAYGPRSSAVAECLNLRGMLCKYLGRFADGERHYRAALSLVARRRAADGLRADLYHNLGGIAHARGDARAGAPWARRAVALRARIVGARHPAVAADEAALAAVLLDLDRPAEAARLYRRALATFRRHAIGDEVALNLAALGALHVRCGRLLRGEEMLVEALAELEPRFGRRHPDVAFVLNDLATVRHRRGDRAVAARLLRRALKIFAASFGPRHPETRTCLANLRMCLRVRSSGS